MLVKAGAKVIGGKPKELPATSETIVGEFRVIEGSNAEGAKRADSDG